MDDFYPSGTLATEVLYCYCLRQQQEIGWRGWWRCNVTSRSGKKGWGRIRRGVELIVRNRVHEAVS